MSQPTDASAERFRAAGYDETPIGYGARPGVVVVDFQHAFTNPRYPMGRSAHVERAVRNTATLLAAARARGVPVAASTASWANRASMQYWKVKACYQDMFEGEPGTAFDERVIDLERDFRFAKTAPSAFFGTPLSAFFTKHGVDTVIVTGCTTSGCVRATIVDSFSHGYRTIVPEECVGDQDEGPHWDNLRDVGRRYADVVRLADVLAYLERLPR
jgi:maleamate amidohydrolase